MQISLSARQYCVRDASDIALGIFFLGVFGVFLAGLLALGCATLLSFLISWDTAVILIPTVGPILWFVGMVLVVRRYLRIARQWTEPRRGSSTLHLVETIFAVVVVALIVSSPVEGDPTLVSLRVFMAVVVLSLAISHVLTYGLLRYRPQTRDLLAWSITGVPAMLEVIRHA